jgi:hypothetical protein
MRSFAPVFLSAVVAWLELAGTAQGGNFYQDTEMTWGDGRGKVVDGGRGLDLTLDRTSGSGFQSKSEYLFGKIDMQIKLVPGNSVARSPPSTCRPRATRTTRSTSSSWAT